MMLTRLINHIAPWSFELVAKAKGSDKHNARDPVLYLSSGDSVRVRSKQSEKLLAVELGILSIIDRLNFLDVDRLLKEDDGGVRWSVRYGKP